MNERERVLQEAFVSEKEFKVSESCVIRRIGLQEEYVLRAAGIPAFNIEFLKRLVENAEDGLLPPEDMETLALVAFVCSRTSGELATLRLAAKRGDAMSIEELFFSWLATMKREDMLTAQAWVAGDLMVLAAARFETEDAPEHSTKNTQIPATQPA